MKTPTETHDEAKQPASAGCHPTACSAWREVPLAEFQDFILHYPKNLEVDIAKMCEPPMKTYNDFTLGNWPKSIVAKVKMYDGSEYHRGRQPVYYLPNDKIHP